MKNIQIGLSIVLGIFIVLGVFVFAGIIPSPKEKAQSEMVGKLTMWGTLSKDIINSLYQNSIAPRYNKLSVKYTQIDPDKLANTLIEALAAGTGPDLVIIPNDLIVRFASKLEPFDPAVFSERQFRDTYIENGEIFIGKNGVLALPMAVDPVVMYWNRDMFTTNGLARPPQYWDEFLTAAPILSKRNESNDILKSAIAFGEFRNVAHAKEVLSMLILQIGNPIVQYGADGLLPVLDGQSALDFPPIDEALRFYTDFSDPQKPIYSWNRSLANSKNAFIAGDLAVYFGLASELTEIRTKNPNLNFDVALVPQVRDGERRLTFGRIAGLAVLRASQQKPAAFFTARLFAQADFNAYIAKMTALPPTRRDLLAKTPVDPFMKIFYDSALLSKSWFDIDKDRTYEIFQNAVESIIAGKTRVDGAVGRAQSEFLLLLKTK